MPDLSKELVDIQATSECGFTIKRVCNTTRRSTENASNSTHSTAE